MQMNSKYLEFYFDGLEDELDGDELDLEELADKVMTGQDDVITVVQKAVAKLAVPLEGGRAKRDWIQETKAADAEHADIVDDDAYAHYLKGQIDGTVLSVTNDLLETMDPREEEQEEDGGDDEDGEDDDDDEEG